MSTLETVDLLDAYKGLFLGYIWTDKLHFTPVGPQRERKP